MAEISVKGCPVIFGEQLVALHHKQAVDCQTALVELSYELFDIGRGDAGGFGGNFFKHFFFSFSALFGQNASVESDLSYRRIFRLDVFIYVGAENYDDSVSKIIGKSPFCILLKLLDKGL